MSKKKIAIIGGGVAGLSAGIYGQRAGYETTIYEKNSVLGGSLSGWYRNGYAIDNCLHWLTGTEEDTPTNLLWKDLGVLNDDTKILDIGAGTGAYSVPLYQEGYDVTAVELVKHNLRRIQSKAPHLKAYQGNAIDLSQFEDSTFDLVLLLYLAQALYRSYQSTKWNMPNLTHFLLLF